MFKFKSIQTYLFTVFSNICLTFPGPRSPRQSVWQPRQCSLPLGGLQQGDLLPRGAPQDRQGVQRPERGAARAQQPRQRAHLPRGVRAGGRALQDDAAARPGAGGPGRGGAGGQQTSH